jgi:hypothetical protein
MSLPPPTLKTSPCLLHPQVKRPALLASDSPHSHSPSASSSDSDDDFVYMLDSVKTAEEAVQRIRAVQQPKERTLTTFLNGLSGSANNLSDMADSATSKAKGEERGRKMKGGLPATMEEFYECPRYTVSLTAAREAVFADALSGFHSYVEREKAQREKLRALQHQHHHRQHGQQLQSQRAGTTDTHVGGNSSSSNTNSALPSFASGATDEWNVALAAAAAATSTQTVSSPSHPALSVHEAKGSTASANPSSEAPSAPTKSRSNASLCGAPVASAFPLRLTDSIIDDSATTTNDGGAEGGEAGSQHLSASYMFIMRSRDTEAMSPVSSPHVNPSDASFGRHSFCEESTLAKAMSALEAPTLSTDAQHTDPNADAVVEGETTAPRLLLPPPAASAVAATPTSLVIVPPDPEQVAKLEELQLQTLLQERIYQRARVPVVFRCRYSLEFAETPEEHRQRVQMRDRALRHNERLAGPGGLTYAMRQRIHEHYADPNTVAPEWPYVWEQFERDVPRETLFIEDTPHRDAEDALAAITSYVEYCYERAHRNIKERSEKLLAAASEGNGEAGKTKGEVTAFSRDGAEKSASPPAPKSRGFFESLFSASSAAIKGAVATVRSSLPDFVGDPLLSASGLDPALYHASLLFPTDPRARSEKIFAAVREVVLASQQSFMGFPYQLLCEQVGTERLGLALEALEMEQEEDDADDAEDAAAAADTSYPAAQQLARKKGGQKEEEQQQQKQKPASMDVSAPIPIRGAEESDPEMARETSAASCRSSMQSSRVVRIYHSFSSPTLLTDNAEGRRHRGHTAHVIDEWNVSSSSSHASDVVCSPFSTETTSTAAPAAVVATKEGTEKTPPNAGKKGWDGGDNVDVASATAAQTEKQAADKMQREAVRPPPLHDFVVDRLVSEARDSTLPPPPRPQPPAAATADAASPPTAKPLKNTVARRRRRERRRRRRSQLPLLVGEPRPYEFALFLDIVRARVAAKAAKEEQRARERGRRERVLRMVERQREQWHSASGSRATSRCTSSASLDKMAAGGHGAAEAASQSPAPAKAKTLFREDVEGSAYLLPTQPTDAADAKTVAALKPTSPFSASFGQQVIPPETRGMRICLFFDEQRNVPVVVVNKLFRLFTMPGVRGLTSSSEDVDEGEEAEGRSCCLPPTAVVGGRDAGAGNTQLSKRTEKSLLLLIQVQFPLFTKEEAEVRWKWWKVD